jgi:hypothetical protein
LKIVYKSEATLTASALSLDSASALYLDWASSSVFIWALI